MKQFLPLLLVILFCGCAGSDDSASEAIPPNTSSNSWDLGAMATAANPHAVAAAIEMLERGGHAVDAAIAAHARSGRAAVLGLGRRRIHAGLLTREWHPDFS